jgi:ATP-dependent protease ClpP protease subunit
MRKFLILLSLLSVFSLSAFAETVTLTSKNSVTLNDVVYSDSVGTAITQLAELEKNEEPVIYLVLDTPGGSVFAGLNLMQYLKGYKKPVKTITIFSASMGFQIVQSNPGERLIIDTGVLMSHPMSGGEYGEIGVGMSMDNRINYLKEIIETMDVGVVNRTNSKQTLESYRKAYDNELWTTGQKAVEAGYADQVVTATCSSELSAETNKYEERVPLQIPLVLDIKYETSKCALNNSMIRYQVAITELVSGRKFVILNKGYEIEAVPTQPEALIYRNYVSDEVRASAEKTAQYKMMMYRITRDFNNIRSLLKPAATK